MSNNRSKGHRTEREWIDFLSSSFSLKKFGKHNGVKVSSAEAEIGSTRHFSPDLDHRKVDVWIKPGLWLHKFFFQVKNRVVKGKARTINVEPLYSMNPPEEGFKILVTAVRRKEKGMKRQVHEKWIVSMEHEDFVKLLNHYKSDTNGCI